MLHPAKHKPLYEVIKCIIKIAIPLWNQTLTPLKLPDFNHPRINYKYCRYDPGPPSRLTGEGPGNYYYESQKVSEFSNFVHKIFIF